MMPAMTAIQFVDDVVSDAVLHPARFARHLLDVAARCERALPELQRAAAAAAEDVRDCQQVATAARAWAHELLAQSRRQADTRRAAL
jgi:hypothetical protein